MIKEKVALEIIETAFDHNIITKFTIYHISQFSGPLIVTKGWIEADVSFSCLLLQGLFVYTLTFIETTVFQIFMVF